MIWTNHRHHPLHTFEVRYQTSLVSFSKDFIVVDVDFMVFADLELAEDMSS
jgi:hypothetical protein